MDVKELPRLTTDVKIPQRAVYGSIEARMLLGGISKATWTKLMASGALKTKRMGRLRVVKHDELMAYIDSLPDGADAVDEIEDGS